MTFAAMPSAVPDWSVAVSDERNLRLLLELAAQLDEQAVKLEQENAAPVAGAPSWLRRAAMHVSGAPAQ